MSDQTPTPPAPPVPTSPNWRQVAAAVLAAALTALLHQLGIVPTCGQIRAERALRDYREAAPADPALCRCQKTGPAPIGAGPVVVPNYGVDLARLRDEGPAYGPGWKPGR
jgi:hypothetical protein